MPTKLRVPSRLPEWCVFYYIVFFDVFLNEVFDVDAALQMMLVRFLTFAATVAAQPNGQPAAKPAIFMDASRPRLEYDCILIDMNKQPIRFAFGATGGRMIFKDGVFAGYSDRIIRVTSDPVGLVSQFPDHYHKLADDYDGGFKHAFGWAEVGSFKIGMYLSAQDIAGREKAALTLHDGYSGSFSAAGLCDVKKTPQQAIFENKKP